ncbi:hypothetical protein AbD4_03912 [Acinetobacter baumannii]|uniref:Uncharacterized protein n=1 Tax=Acinetobacter baumannii TaxID=470 RepID=A0AAJ0QWG2_ACIBA|nr:hypothetical protein LV35_01892 [Acinetobacter baumannii]KZA28931.1 hypothetical protein LV38_00619 [Acinetobacter baumannii]KZA35589.1 hypothetical protein LV40_00553 [Acinetobacter baumannii]QUX89622.1 hypothetical protein AbD4_03912 [Acinetobacter baumannii]
MRELSISEFDLVAGALKMQINVKMLKNFSCL